MANANAALGFKPLRHRNGEPYSGAVNKYFVPASDGTALGIGDPVIVNGTADTNGIPGAIKATAAGGNYITGIVMGIAIEGQAAGSFPTRYRPASTAAYILVADNPDLVFEIQEDAVGGALAAADVGLNADWIDGTMSTTTGNSAVQLDTSTKAATATLQLKILGLVQRVDNDPFVANSKVEVMINLHTQRQAAGN